MPHLHLLLMKIKLNDFILHSAVCLLGVSNVDEHEIDNIYMLFLFLLSGGTVRVDNFFLISLSDRMLNYFCKSILSLLCVEILFYDIDHPKNCREFFIYLNSWSFVILCRPLSCDFRHRSILHLIVLGLGWQVSETPSIFISLISFVLFSPSNWRGVFHVPTFDSANCYSPVVFDLFGIPIFGESAPTHTSEGTRWNN